MSDNGSNPQPDFLDILERVSGLILEELEKAWSEGKPGYRVTFDLDHENQQVAVNTETQSER